MINTVKYTTTNKAVTNVLNDNRYGPGNKQATLGPQQDLIPKPEQGTKDGTWYGYP